MGGCAGEGNRLCFEEEGVDTSPASGHCGGNGIPAGRIVALARTDHRNDLPAVGLRLSQGGRRTLVRDRWVRGRRRADPEKSGPASSPPEPPGFREAVKEVIARKYRDWPHVKIPMLGDRTPLEAISDPVSRGKKFVRFSGLNLSLFPESIPPL